MSFPKFALNRSVAPHLSFDGYLKLCTALNVDAIELRNDLPGIDLYNRSKQKHIQECCAQHAIKILTINALYPFDLWNRDREKQAGTLFEMAEHMGVHAIVCCPFNEKNDVRTPDERKKDLYTALTHLKKLCLASGVRAFIEPLGFTQSALRRKKDAVDAINAVEGQGVFKLVHDTFHHHLAQEKNFFVEYTGIVHVSGVMDSSIALNHLLDAHRVLVYSADQLENIDQLKQFQIARYKGYVSYEPFAESVQNSGTIQRDLKESMNFIRNQLN
ncbi:hypothetical protein COMNV_01037 [Commensalibacter sp. Nvir]|uniref:TIM barrel protein n=1 Tax=Commensalibacter sp. Nvir TaxID=3069817 RepID=UPI002D37E510|nr:hypothetical protein COMNV_01037 [Commensalibacter sp. Nvir]